MVISAIRVLKKRWRVIGVTALSVIALSSAVALFMRPLYQAEVVVIYSEAGQGDQQLALLASRLGGIASLAGLDTGETGGARAEALATLRSRQLSSRFIEEHGLMPYLFADLWDAAKQDWRSKDESPTIADAFERFDENVRGISEDRTTGLITVSMRGRQRELLADWANQLVRDANSRLRDRAVMEAQQSVDFLEKQLAKTNEIEVRQAIYQLMETQISKATLANVREDYAFRVIDPAVTPQADDYIRPNRPLIVALGVLAGCVIGFLIALLKESWSEARE